MRIIGGRHRGAKLADLAGNKTRPTADRVRESIFNILAGGRYGSPLISGIVLDLFAGTGASPGRVVPMWKTCLGSS